MNDTARQTVSLTDIDLVLPDEFEILPLSDPDMQFPQAVRMVRHTTTGQTYIFDTPRKYLQFVLSAAPRLLLAEVAQTRYIQLSAQYDSDPYFDTSVTHTIAAFTRNKVVLHRMKSDETSVRFELSRTEMALLVSGYQSYLDDSEGDDGEDGEHENMRDPFLDFPDDLL